MLIHGNVSSALFWQELMQDLPERPAGHRDRPARLRRHRARARRRDPRACATSATTCTRRSRRSASRPRTWSAGRWAAASSCSTRSTTPCSEPHPAGAGLAVRLRRHAPRRHAAHRRRRGHRRRRREPRLRAAARSTATRPTRPRPRRAACSARATSPPGYTSEHEDVWVESMLTTSTADGNYPGDGVASRELARLRGRARSAC